MGRLNSNQLFDCITFQLLNDCETNIKAKSKIFSLKNFGERITSSILLTNNQKTDQNVSRSFKYFFPAVLLINVLRFFSLPMSATFEKSKSFY
jgi:hypothetical protein